MSILIDNLGFENKSRIIFVKSLGVLGTLLAQNVEISENL